MKKTCFIVGAGSFDGMIIRPQPGDFVIAADGGYTHLQSQKIDPDVLLGDFDSLEVVPGHRNLIRHSPIKDDTDMALAAYYALEQGYERLFLYGGLGGKRFDHSIANLQLVTGLARKQAEVYLIGEGNIVTAIHGDKNGPARICFDDRAEGYLSVFAVGDEALGVTERGLKYETDRLTFTCDKTLGVSNEFVGTFSSVEVERGTLVIMWDEKNGLPACREHGEDKNGCNLE